MTLHKSKRYHKKYVLKHIIRILHYNISEVLIMKKIYTCMPLKEKHKKLLESSSSNCEFIHLGQIKPSLEQVKDANVIIGNIPVDILKNIPNLEFVQLNSAGTNGYSDNPDFPKNVLLANATGAYGVAISECILAGILTLLKHIPSYIKNQSDHDWRMKEVLNRFIILIFLYLVWVILVKSFLKEPMRWVLILRGLKEILKINQIILINYVQWIHYMMN